MAELDIIEVKSPPRRYELLEQQVFKIFNIGNRITLSDIEKNSEVQRMIDKQDNGLRTNLHDRGHVEKVRDIGVKILTGLHYSENDKLVEDFKIAALLHDIGNSKGRENHAQNGAIMAEELLLAMSCEKNNKEINEYKDKFERYKEERLNSNLTLNKNKQLKQFESFEQILRITNIIAKHSDQEISNETQKLINNLGADFGKLLAIIEIGDKFDLRMTRTRKDGFDNDYKRVNQCIKHPNISVTKNKINLNLITDEEMIRSIYGNEEKFLKALLKTDGNKLIHCNRLALQFLRHNVIVELNGNLINIPKLFDKFKPTTGHFTK